MLTGIDAIRETTFAGIDRVASHVHSPADIRVGVELKFPVVQADGSAATREQVLSIFRRLIDLGWSGDYEKGSLIGARLAGEMNDTLAACETGYCKAEFSLAHTSDLHAMSRQAEQLQDALTPYLEHNGIALPGLGIHPVTTPSRELKMNQSRAGVWGKIFRSNQHIGEADGDDVDLFTVNSANHVHVGVARSNAADVINALNGFAPAMIAIGANARVWNNAVDKNHASVAEAFWDWWEPARGRVGMPDRRFTDLDDYLDLVTGLQCLYVKRPDGPVALQPALPLRELLEQTKAQGSTIDGARTTIQPEPGDSDLHHSCYWYNARLSRYYTVESRVFDQQPPDALLAPAAMVLGLAAAPQEACEALNLYSWDALRQARIDAYKHGLTRHSTVDLIELAAAAIDVARLGLERRGLGEAEYLTPFVTRLAEGNSPADEAAELFLRRGAGALVEARRWA